MTTLVGLINYGSHEHPDHFSPLCVKKIPEQYRSNIDVYFQETSDQKIVEFCNNLNFKDVVEMAPLKVYKLGEEFEMVCSPWDGYDDSWCYIRTPEASILNLNDCQVNTIEDMQRVKNEIGEVDVLFTQFSISAWDGNANEYERRLNGAKTILDRAVIQTNFFEPKYIVPFASFIWFCHEENSYMNTGFLPIQDVYSKLNDETNAEVLLMAPGDVWNFDDEYSSDAALAFYRKAQEELTGRELVKSNFVAEQELIKISLNFSDRFMETCDLLKLHLHLARQIPSWRRDRANGSYGFFDQITTWCSVLTFNHEKARIYVSDLDECYFFSIFNGLEPANINKENCDVSMKSGALYYALKFPWGGGTLRINGRFEQIKDGGICPLNHFFSLSGALNANKFVRWNSDLLNLILRPISLWLNPRVRRHC